jgi:hypothetical protein
MVFFFRSEIFFQTTQELEYLFFLSHKAQIIFPEFNIRLYVKISEADYFFSSTKITKDRLSPLSKPRHRNSIFTVNTPILDICTKYYQK